MNVPVRLVTGVHEVHVALALAPLRTTVTVAPTFPLITAVVPPAVRRIAPPPVERAEVVSEVVLGLEVLLGAKRAWFAPHEYGSPGADGAGGEAVTPARGAGYGAAGRVAPAAVPHARTAPRMPAASGVPHPLITPRLTGWPPAAPARRPGPARSPTPRGRSPC